MLSLVTTEKLKNKANTCAGVVYYGKAVKDISSDMTLERFRVESLLGEGGMARVYRVRHTSLDSLHALKVLTVGSKQVRQRLLREGQAQAKLRHPNIVAVTDVLDLNGAPGLVMEYVQGPSLEALLRVYPLKLDEIDAIGRQLLAGLQAAHNHNLVHRDLKPGNIMLDIEHGDVVAKITDFGIAKFLESDDSDGPKTRTGMAMGTPQYMSPEQIKNTKDVSQVSDVWAIGCILYELLTAVRAFDGDNLLQIFNNVASGEYEPVTRFRPDTPLRMQKAIEAALQVEISDRCQTVDELLRIWTDNCTSPIVEWGAMILAGRQAHQEHCDSLPSIPESQPLPTFFELPEPAGSISSPTTTSTGSKASMLIGLGGGVLGLGGLAVAGLAAGFAYFYVSNLEEKVVTVERIREVMVPADPVAEPEDGEEVPEDETSQATEATEPAAVDPTEADPAEGQPPKEATEPTTPEEPDATEPPNEPGDGVVEAEQPQEPAVNLTKEAVEPPAEEKSGLNSAQASERRAAIDAVANPGPLELNAIGQLMIKDVDRGVREHAFSKLYGIASQGSHARAISGLFSKAALSASQMKQVMPVAGASGNPTLLSKGLKHSDNGVVLLAISQTANASKSGKLGKSRAEKMLNPLVSHPSNKVAKKAKAAIAGL